jgi:tetratricopeptide (TPR) repeat protein
MNDRLAALRGFLEQDPDDAFTRYALALEHLSAGDTDTAIALLRETIERDPAYVPAYHQLGMALHRIGALTEAAACYEQGIAAARSANERHAADEMTRELEDLQDEMA